MKKIYLLLVTVLAAVTATAYDFSAVDENGNTIYYNLLGDDSVEVTYKNIDYSCYSGTIKVPSFVYFDSIYYRVCGIGMHAFENSWDSLFVSLPNSITYIDSYAFFNCTGLISIAMPDIIEKIGESAFRDCQNLASINIPRGISKIACETFSGCINVDSIIIPEGVTLIDDLAFCQCKSLKYIDFPSSLLSIGNSVFSGCERITCINLPHGLVNVGREVFGGCKNLTTVIFPSTVQSIKGVLFADCDNLESIVVADGNPTYDSRNNCNAVIETASNTIIGGCKNTQIPDGVRKIGDYAFSSCIGLTSVILPSSVTDIGNQAFESCTNIENLSLGDSLQIIGGSAFGGCKITQINFPNTLRYIGSYSFACCKHLKSIEIPSSVIGIYDGAFEGCDSVASINVSEENGVYDSRENCNAIVETSSNKLIVGCGTTIIPNSVTSIGRNAFAYFTCIKYIKIPSTITAIESMAFDRWSQLNLMVCCATTPPTLGNNVFQGIPSDAVLSVPYNSINAYQFSNYANAFAEIKGFSEVTDITTTTATIQWLTDPDVTEYTINIYTSDTLCQQHIVDGEGQILSSQHFASVICKMKMDTTTSSTDYYVLTINDLEAETDYNYEITGTNSNNVPVYHEEGEFTTEEDKEGLFDPFVNETHRSRKILRNGQLFILRDGKTYNAQGIEVK